MTQNPPELYLSLLSGRPGGVSPISTDSRHINDTSRISDHLFRNDLHRLTDLLDAFASICVGKEKGEVFFVSLDIGPDFASLYVASNDTVPLNVTTHLHKIRGQLKALKVISEFDSPIPADSESSPIPNNTKSAAFIASELNLQKTIYEHSYKKLQRRFLKRAPLILDKFPAIENRFRSSSSKDKKLLLITIPVLRWLKGLLKGENPPNQFDLVSVIKAIDALNKAWHQRLNDTNDDILTRWDQVIYESYPDQFEVLSLRRLLTKFLAIHSHIQTITRVAWSKRLEPILNGRFTVVPVPACHQDISIQFSEQNVLPIISSPERSASEEVKKAVYDKLLGRLKERAANENVDLKGGATRALQLTMNVRVHAECTLLVYHLQHPDTKPFQYFGGSKLSCHGCATFFRSFNCVCETFQHLPFFTKGCHNKIYLRWACPFLLSQEQRIRLKDKEPNLDTRVREDMVALLSHELDKYVTAHAEFSTPTGASGYSIQSSMDELKNMCTLLGLKPIDNYVSGNFRCLLCPDKARFFVFQGVGDHLRAKHGVPIAEEGQHYAPL